MVRGAKNVFRIDRPVADIGRGFVRRTDHLAARDTGSGEELAVGSRPVTATGCSGGGLVEIRRATVLAQAEDQRVIEHSSAIHVVQQRRERAVECGQQELAHPRVMVVMRVPAFVGLTILVPADGDEFDSRFEQPSSGETGLAEERHAVLLAQADRLAFEAECVADLRLRQELKRLIALPVIPVRGGRGFDL